MKLFWMRPSSFRLGDLSDYVRPEHVRGVRIYAYTGVLMLVYRRDLVSKCSSTAVESIHLLFPQPTAESRILDTPRLVRAFARSYTVSTKRCSGSTRAVKFEIAAFIHCSTKTNCYSRTPVVGRSIFWIPSMSGGLNLIPVPDRNHPHHLTEVEKKQHLAGCRLMFIISNRLDIVFTALRSHSTNVCYQMMSSSE